MHLFTGALCYGNEFRNRALFCCLIIGTLRRQSPNMGLREPPLISCEKMDG